MMKNVLVVLLLLVIGAVAFVATRPNEFHVQRSATIVAPRDLVYARIDDLHQWAAWSPWEGRDPQMKKEFSGASAGVGSMYHWIGNDKVGEGRMTVTEARPGERVVILLEFIKPFASTCTTTFALAPEGAGTKVTWSMDGKNNLMSKAMSVFASMDKMVGPDFEHGLASLKTLAEAAPVPAAADSAVTAPASAPANP